MVRIGALLTASVAEGMETPQLLVAPTMGFGAFCSGCLFSTETNGAPTLRQRGTASLQRPFHDDHHVGVSFS